MFPVDPRLCLLIPAKSTDGGGCLPYLELFGLGGDLLFFMVLFLLAYYKLEQSGTLVTVEGSSARRLTLDPPVSFGCLQSATSS
jgi:hypothetical protein